MKVILASDSYFPVVSGVSVVVRYLAQELSKRKHQVAIVCMGTKLSLSQEKEGKVSIFRLPSVINPVRIDHRIALPISAKMKKLMLKLKPEIIHVHTPGTVGLWALMFGQKNKIPSLATCHGVPGFALSYFDFLSANFNRSLAKGLWQYYCWFFNRADHLLAPSEYIKKQLRKNGVKIKIDVLPMWLDRMKREKKSKKDLRRKWGIPEEKTVFLYLGRLDKDKSLEMIFKAAQILKRKKELKEKIFFLMAGKGCYEQGLRDFVKEKKLTDLVKFTGFLEEKDMAGIHKLADVFVMPGLFEAQSLVTLQAIIYGLPVLLADSGALPEIAKRFGQYASLFKPQSVLDLASKMEKFVFKPPGKKFIPSQRFFQFYGKKRHLDRLEQIYLKNI